MVDLEVVELHPSRSLGHRSKGFGIGGAYERPLRKTIGVVTKGGSVYGTVPPSGYYGGGEGPVPFEFGRAVFGHEISLYADQYGREAIGRMSES